jgi:hypothetical protein
MFRKDLSEFLQHFFYKAGAPHEAIYDSVCCGFIVYCTRASPPHSLRMGGHHQRPSHSLMGERSSNCVFRRASVHALARVSPKKLKPRSCCPWEGEARLVAIFFMRSRKKNPRRIQGCRL